MFSSAICIWIKHGILILFFEACLLISFISFRESTLTKRIKFDLEKALDKAHILLGISVSVENIDAIIKIIKKSENIEAAKKALLSKKWKILITRFFLS